MGKGAGPTPDFKGAAEQQGDSSKQNIGQQTLANRANQSSPFSNEQWSQGPDGSWQRNLGFSGGLQAGASSLSDQAGQALGQPLDDSLFGPVMGGDAARDQAITGAYNQATSRLDPQWDQRMNSEQAQLSNMGLDPNSEAARTQMGNLGRERNDAYGSAMNSAIGQGTQAGQAVFNQNAQQHQMALADALRRRSAPIEQMGQLQSLFQTPGYNTAGAADATNYFGAQQAQSGWEMQNAQMQNQFWGDLAGGVMGMAGSAAKLSDERLKQDIERMPIEAMPGVPFASWEWKHSPGFRETGVIAQDLQKVAPHLVHEGPGGFLLVDYSFLTPRGP